MTPTLKSLIINRQKAINQGNIEEFKRLRNQVNRQRKICRAKYYKTTVQHLKQCKSNAWWNEVKKLSGMKVVEENSDKIVKALIVGTVKVVNSLKCAFFYTNSKLVLSYRV